MLSFLPVKGGERQMMKLLSGILQKSKRKVKQHLPSPYPTYRLVLKKDAWDNLKKAKGWKTYQDGASAMGLTRQSLYMADKTRVQVGPDLISRWAACVGNINGNWWIHFELIPDGVEDPNHPKWNNLKHNGEIPYTKYSIAAEFRKNEYSVEQVGR